MNEGVKKCFEQKHLVIKVLNELLEEFFAGKEEVELRCNPKDMHGAEWRPQIEGDIETVGVFRDGMIRELVRVEGDNPLVMMAEVVAVLKSLWSAGEL